MFVLLLIVTFTISAAIAHLVTRLFDRPLAAIVHRLIPDELSLAWQRYILFGLYLVGINGGVRIWEFEKYVLPARGTPEPLVLNADRWALEVYRTLGGTLRGMAIVLLIVFGTALLGYVIVRARELDAERAARVKEQWEQRKAERWEARERQRAEAATA